MNLKIDRLTLCNFKGATATTMNFGCSDATVYGANATGKSTLLDGFLWLLFGKDSSDNKDFNIKTIDPNTGESIHRADHYVEADLCIDGVETTIRRSYREKWVTKRGESEAECNSHETVYEIDGIPFKAGDYTRYIANLINESIFKVITNPLYFNERLKWQDRRELLIQLAGNIDTTELNATHAEILSQMNGKTIADFKSQIAAQKSKAKAEKQQCQPRIAEVTHSLPQVQDWAAIKNEIKEKEDLIKNLEEQIYDINKANASAIDARQQLMVEKARYNQELNNMVFEEVEKQSLQARELQSIISKAKDELSNLENQLRAIESLRKALTAQLEASKARLPRIESNIEQYRAEWSAENKKQFTFDEALTVCPACGQMLPQGSVQQKREHLEQVFIDNKKRQLDAIVEKARIENLAMASAAKAIEEIENEFSQLDDTEMLQGVIEEKRANIEQMNLSGSNINEASIAAAVAETDQAKKLLKKIEEIKQQLEQPIEKTQSEDIEAIRSQISTLRQVIDQLKETLSQKEIIAKGKERIKELEQQEKTLAQQIALLEKQEFAIFEYTKDSINNIENAINSKFKLVRFKMFESQLNGGETECCLTTINGVPWADLNTAAKVQAGMDIIRAFSNYYDCHAPVFIDNRESVTEIPPIDSQVISLVVSPEYKKLTLIPISNN